MAVVADEPVDFDREIKPLLSDRCFICHGPDAGKREAELRLDLEAAAKESAIVPGKPSESELVQRITSEDPDVIMPPPETGLKLTPDERSRLVRWVKQGAPWQKHWSFVPPRVAAPPEFPNDTWSQNEIDKFVLRRLQQAKLTPSDAASKATLIRRVTFDITGLPPTLEEIDAFLADDSGKAFEKVVDRLLESKRYGERMTASWLDAARYSDTYGYQVDRDRFVWPWRDWVIRAFNSNMPYDQFVTEQLAGDLLPNATSDQVLATTFNRLHPQKVEGGSTPEEFRVEYVADRTQTVATAFMGLTMECCRCHDHKYDPLSQKEYYQLTSFFDNIDEAGLYSYFTPSVPTPTMPILKSSQQEQQQQLEAVRAEAIVQRDAEARTAMPRFQAWLKAFGATNEKAPLQVTGEVKHLSFDESKVGGKNESVEGHSGKAVKLSGDDAVGVGVGNFKRYEPFTVSLWMNTPDVKDRAVVFHRSRAWTDAGSRGYQLLLEDGKLSASLIHFWPGNAMRVRATEPLPTKQWLHVAMTYDGSSRAAGLRLFVNGEETPTEVVRDNLYKNITGGGGDNIAIGERFRDRGFANGLVDEFRVHNRLLTPIEVAELHAPGALANAMASKDAADADHPLWPFYLQTADEPWQQRQAEVKKATEALCKFQDGLTEIMVMRELPKSRQTYLLTRGAYDARGEPVQSRTPEVLPAMPSDSDTEHFNRLDLARWMCQPDHPLTSRVAVNRIWQLMMGQGLVRTPEDFGRQGQPPTHPELLDWLARDFTNHQWDMKRLIKKIVLSATYQQSSSADKPKLSVDPQNRLWGRAEAFRFPAEMLRDQALAISGLLVEKQGGPPVRPYELEASFKPSKRDKGEGLYRRSLYTFWKRTGPAPMMMVLDSAKRDVCRVKRERTATPLQSFVMMNSPQFVEAARVLAERVLSEADLNDSQRVTKVFRATTGRPPAKGELAVLTSLLNKQRERFKADPESAKQYRRVGDSGKKESLDDVEVAALTALVNAMLNYDETVMRR